jgi:hypothetical protein
VEIIAAEAMRLMKVSDAGELRRQVDSIAEMLRMKPYPTVEAIMNTNEIAAREYGAAVEKSAGVMGSALELDDEGFIDDLISRLSASPS